MTLTPAASIENPPPVVIVAFYLLPEYWAWENTCVAASKIELAKKEEANSSNCRGANSVLVAKLAKHVLGLHLLQFLRFLTIHK